MFAVHFSKLGEVAFSGWVIGMMQRFGESIRLLSRCEIAIAVNFRSGPNHSVVGIPTTITFSSIKSAELSRKCYVDQLSIFLQECAVRIHRSDFQITTARKAAYTMKKTTFLLVASMVAFSISSTAQASGPLRSIFNSDCDSAYGCAAAACDSDCDAGCDSHGGYGERLKTLWKSNDDCCPESCCYVSLFGGWSFLHDFNSMDIAGGGRGTFSDGWAVGGAVGRRFGHGLRGEIESSFRSNTADQITALGTTNDWSGHSFAYTAMANMYYDISALQFVGVTPYIGGGIGVAAFDADIETPLGPIDVHDAAFAYQGIAGAAKRIHRNVDAFAEYRYLGTTDVSTDLNGAAIGDARPEYENVFFGVRFNR